MKVNLVSRILFISLSLLPNLFEILREYQRENSSPRTPGTTNNKAEKERKSGLFSRSTMKKTLKLVRILFTQKGHVQLQ